MRNLIQVCFFSLVLSLAATGCVSKERAALRAREAYLAGQQQGMAAAAHKKTENPTVTIRGDVKNSSIPWTEDLTVGKALVAAEYLGLSDPKTIVLTHENQVTQIKASELLQGNDFPVEAGDIIEVRR